MNTKAADRRNWSAEELHEALGYLSNPEVLAGYDIAVPAHKAAEFRREYRRRSGYGGDLGRVSGCYFLASEKKRAVQYRIQYRPQGRSPRSLERRAQRNGTPDRRRVSNKQLFWAMIDLGFRIGAPPDHERLARRVPEEHRGVFAYGWALAHAKSAADRKEFHQARKAAAVSALGRFRLRAASAGGRRARILQAVRQPEFRRQTLAAYGHDCCVCGNSAVDERRTYETEAAHICPKAQNGSDDVRNGMALCRKHHWAFDRGLWGVDGSYRILISRRLNAAARKRLGLEPGAPVRLPEDRRLRPAGSALAWHRKAHRL